MELCNLIFSHSSIELETELFLEVRRNVIKQKKFIKVKINHIYDQRHIPTDIYIETDKKFKILSKLLS